jgi:hypothetical protein
MACVLACILIEAIEILDSLLPGLALRRCRDQFANLAQTVRGHAAVNRFAVPWFDDVGQRRFLPRPPIAKPIPQGRLKSGFSWTLTAERHAPNMVI